jgi:putative toxin-antitoxin system antitoxin component (TIGR02293 family)
MVTASKIAESLGGRSVMKERLADYTAVIQRAQAGLPYAALETIAKRYAVPVTRLAQILGIPDRTLARRKKERRLSADESDRLVRMARVTAVADDVLETSEIAATWLQTPNGALGGIAPLDLLGTDLGAEQVETILIRIDYGVYS